MKKYILITVLIIASCLKSFSQYFTEERKKDSLKLDSLKRALPVLKGNEKVNTLIEVSEKFGSFYGLGGFEHRTDSMKLYAQEANKLANKTGYKYGIAKSLLALVNSKGFQGIKDSVSMKDLKEAIGIGEEIKNDSILGKAYYQLAGFEDKAGNYKKAIQYFEKAGDFGTVAEVYTWLCMDYTYKGEYEVAFEYGQKSLELAKKNAHTAWGHELVQWALYDMADLYKAAGDYESAMTSLKEARQYGQLHDLEWNMSDGIGDVFLLMNKPDSALYYLEDFKRNAPMNQLGADLRIGETYLSMHAYAKAKQLFKFVVDSLKKSKDPFLPFLTRGLINMGKAYAGENNYKDAFKYAKEGYSIIRYYSDPQFLMDTYKFLGDVYHHIGRNDSAYLYLNRYSILKDSTQNTQFLWRLNNKLNIYKKAAEDEKKKAEIGLLNKNIKIKSQQLKQETQQKYFLLILLSALTLAGIFVYRSIALKRKNEKLVLQNTLAVQQLDSEKKQAEFLRQTAELEMQALRAQMNPHFIFNCLSSINRFILKNESKMASNYLTRFSRLMRMVLMNSQKSLIALEDELEMLRLYLEMERLRFKNSFDYGITLLNEIDSGNIFIPPLLLQPFCENAIWHGLMHLPSVQSGRQGRLDIELSMQENILLCIITDNGIGREKAAELKSKTAEKEKSMGLKITTERLALINREKGIQTFYEIEDVENESGNIAGTKVTIRISFKESIEETV
jgi:tetratricopeptide (TPR) repeat protein